MSLPGMSAGQETGATSVPRAPADAPESSAGATLEAQARSVGGRPSKYDPAFCEAIIAHGAEGLSLNAFAGKISVSRRTLFNWAEQFPEFADAFEIAKAKACGWWEEKAKIIGEGDGGPGAAAMVQFMLKNYGEGDFSDRREVTYSGAVNHNLLTHEQAVEEARRRGLPERVLIADNSDHVQ